MAAPASSGPTTFVICHLSSACFLPNLKLNAILRNLSTRCASPTKTTSPPHAAPLVSGYTELIILYLTKKTLLLVRSLSKEEKDIMATHTYEFNVTMTCGGCSGAIERVLSRMDGAS